MPKFRKKPVVIEARQFTGGDVSVHEILMWGDDYRCPMTFKEPDLIISTIEGDMRATPGDWIIRGVHDEFYPCKPDIFEETYEEVEE